MLEGLRKVAAFDAKLFELEEKKRKIPLLLRQREQQLEQAKQALAEKEAELKALRLKNDIKERELQDAEQAVIKFRNQINQAKTNKEFQALQHEILSKEADNARLEDQVLIGMQKYDKQKEEIASHAEEVKKIEGLLDSERAELRREEKAVTAECETLQSERSEDAKHVPPEMFAKYERLISRRGQTAMVAVTNGSCQGCFMTLRPETMAQLKKGTDLVTCHSCGRILYIED